MFFQSCRDLSLAQLTRRAVVQYRSACRLHFDGYIWWVWIPHHRNLFAIWSRYGNFVLQGRFTPTCNSNSIPLTHYSQGIMAFSIFWNATVCFSKLSVLLMYTALIPIQSMIRWAQGIGFFIIVWNIANILAAFLICRPLARNWDLTIPGRCGSQPKFFFSMGIVNIVTDIALLVLPMPYLYQLRMSTQKKLIASGLLSVGIM